MAGGSQPAEAGEGGAYPLGGHLQAKGQWAVRKERYPPLEPEGQVGKELPSIQW